MWHRLNRDDFDKTGEIMGTRSGGRIWGACEEYEIRRMPDALEGETLPYVLVPKYSRTPARHIEKWRIYEPLKDTPDLFLRFARLYTKGDSIQPILEWVHRYGTLGHGQPAWQMAAPQDVREFRQAVREAAGILALYEAVLNGDGEKAKSVILEEFPYVGIWWRAYCAVPNKPAYMDRKFTADQISQTVEEIYDGDYLWFAIETVMDEVNRMVRTLCSAELSIEEGSHDPSQVTVEWNFMSLLGSMYLQMYWLMAAGGNVTRCEYCGQIISLARPEPEARKPPQHKRFCDKACRQSYHYHNRIKPQKPECSR